MAIPDFEEIMYPLLEVISDGKHHSMRNTISMLADKFSLSHEEREERYPSGNDRIFDNRVRFSKLYLLRAGVLNAPRYGYIEITERGKEILKSPIQAIDSKYLLKYDEFKDFINKKGLDQSEKIESNRKSEKAVENIPEEQIEKGYSEIKQNLSTELLEQIKNSSPSFFENLVIDLLLKIGYGGSKAEAGKAIGRTGDGGIDGIIKEDKLGLDIIYIQAKRWENVVPTSEVHKFAGALLAQRAKKGIFITTSRFPQNAFEYVKNIDSKIILIDGEMLADLMIESNVGVSVNKVYEVKKIDYDYFLED